MGAILRLWPALALACMASQTAAAPVIIGTYYEERLDKTCVSTGCELLFSPAPAGKRITNKGFDCEYSTMHFHMGPVAVRIGGTDARLRHMKPELVSEASDQRTYISQYATPFMFGDGVLKVTASGFADPGGFNIYMTCILTGELSNK